jgi:hypothetical protein
MVAALIFLVVSLGGLIWGINATLGQSPIVYDCSMAEISPDIPVKVKEECRKLRSQR